MKIDGLEFMDWLHKIRRESERKRKERNLSGVEWLREVEKQAEEVMRKVRLKKEVCQSLHRNTMEDG